MGRPRQFDEKQVVDAAQEQFWLGGYTATTLDDLMAATGLGKGSIYRAFGDKHQLFLRVLDEYRAAQLARFHEILDGTGPAWDRLSTVVVTAAESASSELGRRGSMLANSVGELNVRDVHVTSRALEDYGAIEDLLTTCVTSAQTEGDIPASADPRALARMLLAVLQGLEFLGKCGTAPETLHQIAQTTLAALRT